MSGRLKLFTFALLFLVAASLGDVTNISAQTATEAGGRVPKLAVAATNPKHKSTTIFLMDPNGKNALALTNDDNDNSYPSWSPDGTKLAFVSSGSMDRSRSIVVLKLGNP